MSIQRAIFIKLSGAEPYLGGDWNEYHESPIFIETNKTGIIIRDDFNVSGDAYFDSGSYFSGHLYQHKDYNSYLSGKLFVGETGYISGDANVLRDLDVSGNLDVRGQVSITGFTEIQNNLGVSGNLSLTGDAYLHSDLLVNQTGYVTGDLFVGTNEYISGNLFAIKTGFINEAQISGDLFVGQTGYITGDLNISGKTHASGEANFYTDPKVHSNLYVSGDSILSGNKYVSGNLNVLNNANISGDLIVQNTGYVEKDLFVGGDLFISGDKTIVSTKDLVVEDKNIQLAWSSGDLGKFSKSQLDGAGLTIVATGALENNSSLNFDGVDDYAVANNLSCHARPLSLSFWFYPTADKEMVLFHSKDDLWFQVTLRSSSHGSKIQFYDSQSTMKESTGTWTTNQWNHFVVTVDTLNKTRFYLNGKFDSLHSNMIILLRGSIDFMIGARWDSGGSKITSPFQGQLDEIATWNAVLTDQSVNVGTTAGGDIEKIYNLGAPTDLKASVSYNNAQNNINSLTNWWRMDTTALTNSKGVVSLTYVGAGGTNSLSTNTPGPTATVSEDILFVYDKGYDALKTNVNLFGSEDLFVEETGHMNNLVVSGSTVFKSGVYFEDDAFLSTGYADELIVSGTGHIEKLIVSGESVLKDNLYVEKTGYISGDLDVSGDVNVTGDFKVHGSLGFNHAEVDKNFYVGDKLYAGSGVIASGDLIVSTTGYITGDLNIQDNLNVSGSGFIDELFVKTGKINDLEVSGDVDLNDFVKIHKTGYVGELLEVSGKTIVKDNFYLEKTGYISGDLDVSGDLDIHGTGYITGDLNVTGDVKITGDVTVGGTFYPLTHQSVPGDFYVGDEFYVKNGIVSSGYVLAEGAITGQKGLVITGDSHISNLDATGSVDISGNVDITGDLDISGDTNSIGDSKIIGNLVVSGNIEETGNTNKTGITNHKGDFNLDGDLDVTGNLFIDGNIYNTGNNFVLDTTTLRVFDKNIELATGSGQGNLRRNELDGAGITIKASGDNNDITLLYKNAGSSYHTNVGFTTSGELNAYGKSKIENNLFVSGILDTTGKSFFRKDLKAFSNVDISGTTSITGKATIQDDLDVSGQLDVTGKTFLRKDLKLDQTGYVLGDFNIFNDLEVSGNVDISGKTTIQDDLDVSGVLHVTGGNTFLGENLYVNKTGYITGDLNVTGSGRYGDDILLERSQSGLAISAIEGVGSGIRVNDWIIKHTIIQTDTNNKSFTEYLNDGPNASDVISMNAAVYRHSDSIAYSVYSVANPSQEPDGPGYNFEISYSGNTIKVVDLDDALEIADVVTVDFRYIVT